MITRISKIARLPVSIRNELNTRLQNGEIGRTLLPWLNHLPETKSVMADLFNGKPITHQNLSEWRRAGYQDWFIQQQRLLWFQTLTEQEGEINQHDHSTDTFEAMSNYFIFELGQAITSLQTIKNSPERLNRLETLTREFSRLQNSFNWSRRVQLEWSKYNNTLPDTETHDIIEAGEASPSASTVPASRKQEIIEIQAEPSTPERQKIGALQDAPRISETPGQRASVLDCGSPLPISAANSELPTSISAPTDSQTPQLINSKTPTSFQPLPTPAPTTSLLQIPTPNSYLRTPRPSPIPARGRRFVCIEG